MCGGAEDATFTYQAQTLVAIHSALGFGRSHGVGLALWTAQVGTRLYETNNSLSLVTIVATARRNGKASHSEGICGVLTFKSIHGPTVR